MQGTDLLMDVDDTSPQITEGDPDVCNVRKR